MSWTSSLGGFLNNITGATSAASQSQKYALQSAAVNNIYQKEFAQNAHQWEIEDLKRAGLNPVLSAGGSGASASGGGVNSGSAAASGINPMETVIGTWNGVENARKTAQETEKEKAMIKNIDAETALKGIQTLSEMERGPLTNEQRKQVKAEKDQIIKMTPILAEQAKSQTKLTTAQRKQYQEEAERLKMENQWNKDHPIAYSFGKYTDAVGNGLGKILDIGVKAYGVHKFKKFGSAFLGGVKGTTRRRKK